MSKSYLVKAIVRRIAEHHNAEEKLDVLDKVLTKYKNNQNIKEILNELKKEDILNENDIELITNDVEQNPDKECIFILHNVKKSYVTPEGLFEALKNVELDIYKGEIVIILGYSGSGKSTLLNILGLLNTPDEGSRIYYNGIPYTYLSIKEKDRLRRHEFGFIFQESHLLSHLSALENVTLPLRLQKKSNKECIEAAREMLEKFMTDEEKKNKEVFFKKKPAELSGGQKQRVAAARAMVHKPEVIFADEPTGSLDFTTGDRVMNALLQAAKEFKTTVILVTHNISQAKKFSEDERYKSLIRFVWMEEGGLGEYIKTKERIEDTQIFAMNVAKEGRRKRLMNRRKMKKDETKEKKDEI